MRVDVDAVSLEAAARCVRVAFNYHCLGLGEAREALIVPAGLFDRVVSMAFTCQKRAIGSYVGAAGAVARVEAVDITGEVAEGEITELDAGVVGSFGAAGVALVDVCLVGGQSLLSMDISFGLKAAYLGDEDRECDVVDLDVGPGYVAYETLSANPRLQTSSVQAAGDSDAVEVDVGDVGEFTLALAK